MSVKEENLLKALSDMEAIAKSGVSEGMGGKGNVVPKSTSQANGGLSGEGDPKPVSVTAKGQDEDDNDFDFEEFESDVEKGGGKKKKTLSEWAKEEEDEEAHKGMSADEDDESMDDDDEAYKGKKKMKDKACKGTVADLIKSEMGEVLNISPFLEELVDQVSDAEQDLRKSVIELAEQQDVHNKTLRKSVVAMGNLVLDIKKSLDTLMDQPTTDRRSVLSKSEVVERFEEAAPTLSKHQVLDAMVNLVQKGQLNSIEVARYETTNSMEPSVRKAVEDELRKSA